MNGAFHTLEQVYPHKVDKAFFAVDLFENSFTTTYGFVVTPCVFVLLFVPDKFRGE